MTAQLKACEDFERLWTVHDVAEFLRMSRSWVNKRAADGTLPVLRIGRAIRFDPADVRRFASGDLETRPVSVIPLRSKNG